MQLRLEQARRPVNRLNSNRFLTRHSDAKMPAQCLAWLDHLDARSRLPVGEKIKAIVGMGDWLDGKERFALGCKDDNMTQCGIALEQELDARAGIGNGCSTVPAAKAVVPVAGRPSGRAWPASRAARSARRRPTPRRPGSIQWRARRRWRRWPGTCRS